MNRPATLLDANGDPISTALMKAESRISRQSSMIDRIKRQYIQAKYDAAQTFVGNENHWSNADHLGPHSVATNTVRKTLRSRSRYEIIENNPYLKGTLLTIVNDFVGSGPKLQITDKRLSKNRKKVIETRFQQWMKMRRIRQKIWRMRLAKFVDGESFMRAYRNDRSTFPVKLDYQVIETDQISSEHSQPSPFIREVDGVRLDQYDTPVAYHILWEHPGNNYFSPIPKEQGGDWVDSRFVLHWFRQDRGWVRGIPELTPSLPLCSILRRYTLAVVRHAELAADLTAIIETDGPPNSASWTDGQGNPVIDDPFDQFPIEMGMIMNLPWGYKLKQLDAVPLGVQYDEFVGSVLREIMRPALSPYNIASGSSKDSNMASGVLDTHIYKGGQEFERMDCEETVLDPMFNLWWLESRLVPGNLGDNLLQYDPQFRQGGPEHTWRWDRIGIDHTDPSKVAAALEILHTNKFLTDRDIQEEYHNRDVEDWREEVTEDDKFRMSLPSAKAEQALEKQKATAKPTSSSSKKKPSSTSSS